MEHVPQQCMDCEVTKTHMAFSLSSPNYPIFFPSAGLVALPESGFDWFKLNASGLFEFARSGFLDTRLQSCSLFIMTNVSELNIDVVIEIAGQQVAIRSYTSNRMRLIDRTVCFGFSIHV